MLKVTSLKEMKRNQRMQQVQVRLPVALREQARSIAAKEKVTETDVYRSAITLFLSDIVTDSNKDESPDLGLSSASTSFHELAVRK